MANATTEQRDRFASLEQAVADLAVRWDDTRGVIASARGTLARVSAIGEPEASVREFLAAFGELFGPRDLAWSLRLLRTRRDAEGWTHLEFQQVYRGEGRERARASTEAPDVYGAKLAAHVRPDGTLVAVQSSCWRQIDVDLRPRLGPRDFVKVLRDEAEQAPGYRRLAQQMRERKERSFPVIGPSRIVIYPWQAGFRLAWTAYAFTATSATGRSVQAEGELEPAEVFVDAVNGDRFLTLPLTMHVEAPVNGHGRSVTPLGGPYALRDFNVVQVDGTTTHRLKDVTRPAPAGRPIVTYDAGCSGQWMTPDGHTDLQALAAAIAGGTLPVSENNSDTWARTVLAGSRTDSQQPESDAHFFAAEVYEWYGALAAGRAGWDDGQYPDPPIEAGLPIRVVTHAGPCAIPEALFTMRPVGMRLIPFIVFFDGDPTASCSMAGDRGVDFMAGCRSVVAHEYHHLITTFSFIDGNGRPGIGYQGWSAAFHEGLADAFSGLFTGVWEPGPEISGAGLGLVFRNLAFPRDPQAWINRPGPMPCGRRDPAVPEQITKDHFADRNLVPEPPPVDTSDLRVRIYYFRGSILAHCAALLAAGGVHQRASRTPVLIPVPSLGTEMAGGRLVAKPARIWYRALTYYFSTHGALTGNPANDETLFTGFGQACIDAAADLYGAGSPEHRGTSLGFYAVGLHPMPSTTPAAYGADVTFLRWGNDWRMSRPYLGGIHSTSPDWSSLDLFVNNGGASEWNAVVDVRDANNNPTGFENTVYCRVRNVGDQDASNVHVDFFYAKVGTGSTAWLPVTDHLGNAQSLTIATLAAGQSTFADADQDAPPPAASVKWWIPPLAPGDPVDHFCLKAVVTADNDVNPHNNEVQSNIAYVVYQLAHRIAIHFLAANTGKEAIPLELDLDATLPEGWGARLDAGDVRMLEPGEQAPVRLTVEIPPDGDNLFEAPFDGEVRGQIFGHLSGPGRGALTGVVAEGERLAGRLAISVDGIAALVGRFEGLVDRRTGALKGHVEGMAQSAAAAKPEHLKLGFEGWLRPWRRVDVTQRIRGAALGGVTIQVQRAQPEGPWRALPPTHTHAMADR
jgi:hypothetical protein